MDEIIKYLATNPFWANIIISVIILLVLLVVIIVIVSLIQGRSVNLGPLKIGETLADKSNFKVDIFTREKENLVRFLSDFPETLHVELKSNSDVWMMGVILRSTTDKYYDYLLSRVSSGGKVRILISNPKSIDTEKITTRLARKGATTDGVKRRFEIIFEKYSSINNAVNKGGNFELRIIDYIPPYGLYIFPHSGKLGTIYAQLYGYKNKNVSGSLPKFCITEKDNFYWYQHFAGQFEEFWNSAEVYDFNHNQNKAT